jgi:hypothetical protein
VKCDNKFLETRSNWIALLAASVLISLIAIPIHELGHVLGYRITGVAARVAYEHTVLPQGTNFGLLGTASGVFSTYIVSYLGILLIWQKRWLVMAYPLAIILSVVRIMVFGQSLIQFYSVSGLDEAQLAVLTGSNPLLWFAVSMVLFFAAWILIIRSLGYGILKNFILCSIPVFLYIGISTLSLHIVSKYFPRTA